MDEYINQSLMHWTARGKKEKESFEVLKMIINEGFLQLSYSPNYGTPPANPDEYDPLNDRRTIMACFTDLPLQFSKTFCEKFGHFGIGFKKETMITYGANPVMYTTNNHLHRIREINDLINKLLKKEMDRGWREELEPYQFTSDQLYALNEIFGFTQEFSYRNRDENYFQREWRINYETLQNTRNGIAELPGYGRVKGLRGRDLKFEMKFDIADIDFLVVPRRFRKEILKLGFSSDQVKIYEVEVLGRWWRKFF